jgi:hypothetical protein
VNTAADEAAKPSEISEDSPSGTNPAQINQPSPHADAKAVEYRPFPATPNSHSGIPGSFTEDEGDEEENIIFLGLRVYTHTARGPATIGGQLRHEMQAALDELAAPAK